MALPRPLLPTLPLLLCALPAAGQQLAGVEDPPAAAAERRQPVQPTRRPMLWRFEGLTTSWVFGTIHVADERVLALPEGVKAALEECGAFYTETPMDEGATEGLQERLLLPDGETLGEIMPPELGRRLGAYLDSKGYSLTQFERQNLWAVTIQAMTLDEVQGDTGAPLDQVMYEIARKAGKRLDALESFDEQIEPFEQLSTEQRLELLRGTLDMLERYDEQGRNPTEELVRLYLDGDPDELYTHVTETFPAGGPLREQLIGLLLERRNVRMANRIADKLRADRRTSHFFAVGAGHLAGPGGVLALLRSQGFFPRRVDIAEPSGRPPRATPAAAPESTDDLLRAIRDELRNLGRRLEALEHRVTRLEQKR